MEKQGVLNDKKIVGSPMVHMTCLAMVLFAFWMVLSGRTETKFVVYGILTAVVTTWVTYPLLLVPNRTAVKVLCFRFFDSENDYVLFLADVAAGARQY